MALEVLFVPVFGKTVTTERISAAHSERNLCNGRCNALARKFLGKSREARYTSGKVSPRGAGLKDGGDEGESSSDQQLVQQCLKKSCNICMDRLP